MKPISLYIKAFGPYLESIKLDFENGLAGEKIFLIHGATGAGKTTILDAISYALFGESSGKSRDGKMMRSDNAPSDVSTEIEFSFELNGKIFNVWREINYHPNRKENKFQTKCELSCNGEIIATKERELANKIKSIIGFDAEQFRQVVLLPQGEFKKFLSADSEKRQEVSNVLFNCDAYKNIEDRLAERAKSTASKAEELKVKHNALEQQISTLGGESIEAIEEKFAKIQVKLIELKKAADDAQNRFAEGKSLSEKFSLLKITSTELEKTQGMLAEADQTFLLAQAELSRREAEEVQRKELALQTRELCETQTTLETLNSRSTTLETERTKLQRAVTICEDCELKAQRYERRMDILRAEKNSLADADVKFARLETLLTQAHQRDNITSEISRLEKIFASEQKKLVTVTDKFKSAQIKLNRLQIVNSAAHLATTLKDGEPCPVCGSIEHPTVIAEAIPTAIEIQAAENEVDRLTNIKASQEKSLGEINGKLTAQRNNLKNFIEVPSTASVQKNFDEAKIAAEALKKCLASLDKGEKYVRDNKISIDKANAMKNTASTQVAKIEGEMKTLREKIPIGYLNDVTKLHTDLETTQKTLDELNDKWKIAQEKFNEALKNKSARTATFQSVKELFDERQSELADKTPPDIEALKNFRDDTNQAYTTALKENAELQTRLTALKNFSTELEVITKELDEAQKTADMWRRLSDVANATGKGESHLKISFQRYYLSTMFNDVIVEANNRLAKMSGGRYIFHSKDAGKTKAKSAGLNLEIFDANSGALRPVETLSGGESFLASLSLALGLAAVVQNNSGGIKLDTIFIDEGFGSLDSETLDYAIHTIIEQSGGRLVGIISHVEELKNRMPVRLEVTKTKTGSTAKFIS